MERVLEPELMEEDAQAKAYAEADFSSAHNNFVKLFKYYFNNQEISGNVVDLGCGPGDISFRFALAFEQCTIHGVDGSEAMLGYGRKILSNANDIKSRVKLINGMMPDVDLPCGKYDVVICNSTLHHFHNPETFWESVKKYAKPGTPIFVMDLKRAVSVEEAQQLRDKYAANEPEILRNDFYNSLFAAFKYEEIVKQLKEAGLDHLSVKVVTDRHVIITGYMN